MVATAGLVLIIMALARNGRSHRVAYAVGGYIAAAYWFTSSTSFANPAVTVGADFSDTFAGIAPARCRCSCSPRPSVARPARPARAIYPSSHLLPVWRTNVTQNPTADQPDRPDRTDRPTGRVLFVCVHNAGRSQMAAGWLAHLAGGRGRGALGRVRAGRPGQPRRPSQAMAEVGIDITARTTKILDHRRGSAPPTSSSPWAAATPAPSIPGKRYEDWALDDPAGQDLDTVRGVRDRSALASSGS